MFRNSVGIIAMALCLEWTGFAPVSSAQTTVPASAQESGQIRLPSPSVLRDEPIKPIAKGDLPRLEMGKTAGEHSVIHVGPVELVRRNASYDAPWVTPVPFFQRSHEALNLSFAVHRKDR
jgi:hypothetical protein